MTISISNLTVNNNAPAGSVVGVLTAHDASGAVIPCNFTLTKNSAGFFAISGNNLVTASSGLVLAGNYSVRVRADGTNTRFSGNAVFIITVNIAAPPAPSPPAPISPDGSTLYGGATGVLVTAAGTWTFSPTKNADGNWSIQLNGVTQGGPEATTLEVANHGILYSVNVWNLWYSWTGAGPWVGPISSPTAIPTAITLSATNATIPDNAPAGTLIATATVTMSDGSQFAGTLITSDTNFFAISGLNIVTARAFTSVDDGTNSTVITASQGGQSFSMELSV